jgi:hypothetical protein
MNEYFYNEFGMYDEDEEGVKIIRVLDLSQIGCFFARQFKVNDDELRDICRDDHGFEIFDKIERAFTYSTIWALYVVEGHGMQSLKYYRFYNDGVCYQEDSEPDHDYATNLSLTDLHHIYWAITNFE